MTNVKEDFQPYKVGHVSKRDLTPNSLWELSESGNELWEAVTGCDIFKKFFTQLLRVWIILNIPFVIKM